MAEVCNVSGSFEVSFVDGITAYQLDFAWPSVNIAESSEFAV